MHTNNKKYRLSFVIPFFNGGSYIRECLDSLLDQNISEDSYEIIIIDDCSSDKQSLDILSSFESRFSNIKVHHNSRNLRAGGSRNVGILESRGDYIWFVDQDDTIAPNVLDELLRECESNDLDYLSFDFNDNINGVLSAHRLITVDSEVMTGLDYIHSICRDSIWRHEWDTNVWHQLYKREFLTQFGITFSEVSYFDDMIFALRGLFYSKRIKSCSTPYYNYRFNNGSVLHTEVGKTGRTVFDSSICAGYDLISLSEEVSSVDYDLSRQFRESGVWRINSFTKSLLRIRKLQRRLFYDYVKQNRLLVNKCYPFLNGMNRWLLSHERMAISLPSLIRLVIKAKEYIMH